jgi:uncharacterized protein YkwD
MDKLRVTEVLLLILFASGCAQFMTPSELPSSRDVAILVTLHNDFRSEVGAPPVTESELLTEAATNYCAEIDSSGNYSHTGKNGSTPGSRAKAAGYSWSAIAENLGMGYPTAEDAMEGWTNSSAHRANAADPKYSQIGFARCSDKNYWVVMFAKPR